MKRIFQVFVALLLVACCFSASDCYSQDNKQLKVALIFDIGGRGDDGFNDSAFRGFEKAGRKFNIKTVYIEPKRSLDRDSALNALAESDTDMIIGVGFTFTENMNTLAARYPGKKFVCVDYNVGHDDKGNIVPPASNLAALLFREEEGAFLVGAIAALKSRTGKIGFIGGMDGPIIRKFEAGYTAGAKAVRPGILVLSKFTGITGKAFNNPEKGYTLANSMYREGADIIFHASGATGSGVFRAAKNLDKYAIGVDIDQRLQAPGLVLTSMMKNVDVAVFESIRALVEGRFSGGLKVFGLKENGVGFVYDEHNRELVTDVILKKTLTLKDKIIKGKIVVPSAMHGKQQFTENDLREFLSQIHTETMDVLNGLENNLRQCALALSGKSLKGAAAREQLKRLYNSNQYIIDCETVSDKGIMLAVEPEQHRTSEGADISGQAHMVKLFSTKKPVLSGSFRSVEGPEAVVFHYPIFSSGNKFSGSISALFAPRHLLSGIIGPVASNLPINIVLMQTDGRHIYHLDTKQIGLNLLSDPMYKPFPELVSLGKRVAAEKEGSGSYRFYPRGSKEPVIKHAYWKTINLHGTEWRLVINCSSDNIEKKPALDK